ncbi:MAG: TonB family protein [Parvularculaceae bacterium]
MNAPQRFIAGVAIPDSAPPDSAQTDSAKTAAPANHAPADHAPADDAQQVKDGTSTGKRLAAARQAKELSLNEVHAATKIKLPHLVAIEADDHASLPATPFAAGFVKSYAQFLELDAAAFSAQWKRESANGAAHAVASTPERAPRPAPKLLIEPVKTPPKKPARVSTGETKAVIAYTAMAAAAVAIAIFGANAIAVRKSQSAPQSAQAAPAAPAAQAASIEAPMSEAIDDTVDDDAAAAPEPGAEIAAPAPSTREETNAEETTISVSQAEIAAARQTQAENTAAPARTPPQSPVDEEAPAAAAAAETNAIERPDHATENAEARDPREGVQAQKPRDVVEASILRAPAPHYPERCAASAAALEEVAILLDISADGRTENARVAGTSNPCFDGAALNAANRMRFSPRTIDGFPANELARRVTIRFAK